MVTLNGLLILPAEFRAVLGSCGTREAFTGAVSIEAAQKPTRDGLQVK